MKVDYNGDDEIKMEPIEYSPVTFGLESTDAVVPRTTTVAVSGNNGGAVLHSTNTARCYTINTGSAHNQSSGQQHTGTTIVTILPPTPPHPTAMPSLPISLSTSLTTVIMRHFISWYKYGK